MNMQQQMIVGIAAMASFTLLIKDIKYEQYRPAIPFDTLLVPIHMLLQSLQLHSSLVTNGGLRVKYEHPATKNLGIAAMASFCIHQEWNESQKSLFYLFSYFFGSV
jgi:hypothetical protein